MPWKIKDKLDQRFDLVRQMNVGGILVVELSRRFKVSRQTAYKWRERYRQGRIGGLQDRSRRPRGSPHRTSALWRRRLRARRGRHPTWGARKLRHQMGRRFGERGVPTTATMSRWLKRWGLSRGRKRRRKGPVLLRGPVREAGHCHEVWTVDFKGWYCTAGGTRVEPLTVRDLYSRYGLKAELLRTQSIKVTRRAMRRLFVLHGVPERIRCDNGSPFGGGGPTGLTQLSAWWIKLGIEVEFITPGRPCENGSHEQFHRVYKVEVAAQPERTVKAQQRRSTIWLRHYNHQRPHEALGMRRPAELLTRNRRRMPKRLGMWKYPPGWERYWVKGSGEISWHGKRRFVGEAFAGDYVGLQPKGHGVWQVYFGPVHVGEMYEKEDGSIRMAKYRRGG